MIVALALLALPQMGDTPRPSEDRFEPSVLAQGMQRPMQLAIAPDGRVLWIELGGRLACWKPGSGEVVEIAQIPVFADQENGLLGLALDPDFATNRWIYLLRSPPEFTGQELARYTLAGDGLEARSKKVILVFEEQRRECCHHAGSLAFGPDGSLFVSTGDNTHPHADSNGYAPLDERPGREPWNALRGSANTQSFTGKILRILPLEGGGYAIPPDNLFSPDGSHGRAEIYAMGCRNPWRISVDLETGFLYWGDVGPDAGADSERGPMGYDEINQARGPGNFGWPLFIADNQAYADHDYVSGVTGARFDPLRPENRSRTNSGARLLPPARPAWIFYPYGPSERFPVLDAEGGRTACAGPAYHFDPRLDSATKFPRAYDDCLFIYEWSRHWIKVVRMDAQGDILAIEPFLPGHTWKRPVDLEFGPEGSLYLLEYGTTWDANPDARLVRIDHYAGNRPPLARASATPIAGPAPLEVTLSSAGSSDKDGDALRFAWRIAPDAEIVSEEASARFTFATNGVHQVELSVTDAAGARSSAVVPVLVGNSRPSVAFQQPRAGGFLRTGEPVSWRLEVEDPEDDGDDSPQATTAMLERLVLEARFVAGPPPLRAGGAGDHADDAPGLARMKKSDCFNCHAVERALVGPGYLDVAEKRRGDPAALEASVERVLRGSSGLWGGVAMLPHPQHSESEVREMVAWVLALERDAASIVQKGIAGEIAAPALVDGGNAAAQSGVLVLDATYTDGGGEGVPALVGHLAIHLRTARVEAEHASYRSGTQVLGSTTASSGGFIGAVDHGNWLCFEGVDLAGIASVGFRVSSAGAGGGIELHADAPSGPLVASVEVVPNGAWEDWFVLESSVQDPGGLHDLVVVFSHPESPSALLNLDLLEFRPSH